MGLLDKVNNKISSVKGDHHGAARQGISSAKGAHHGTAEQGETNISSAKLFFGSVTGLE